MVECVLLEVFRYCVFARTIEPGYADDHVVFSGRLVYMLSQCCVIVFECRC